MKEAGPSVATKESDQLIPASVDVDVVSELKHETPVGFLNVSSDSVRV